MEQGFFSRVGERAKRGVQLCPRAVLIFSRPPLSVVEHAATRQRARQTEGTNAHQIATKATNGANPKKRRWDSVIRACCSTLKSMVHSLEGCLIWCTSRSNKAQHRNRVNLEVTQSLNQAFGRSIDFQHSLYEFFGVLSNDEGVQLGQSWFQHIWRVEQFASHGTHRNSQKSMSARNRVVQCHTEPNSTCVIQIEASDGIHRTECRCQCSHQPSKRG